MLYFFDMDPNPLKIPPKPTIPSDAPLIERLSVAGNGVGYWPSLRLDNVLAGSSSKPFASYYVYAAVLDRFNRPGHGTLTW